MGGPGRVPVLVAGVVYLQQTSVRMKRIPRRIVVHLCHRVGILVLAAVVFALAPVSADDKKDDQKKTVTGTLTMGDKTYKLESAVAFETTRSDKKRTAVLFSEKSPDLDKLKASLKKNGNDDDYFLTKPNVKLIFDDKGELAQLVIYADGANINLIGSDKVKASATVKDGVVSGKRGMEKPDKCFGMEYTFTVEFNVKIMKP